MINDDHDPKSDQWIRNWNSLLGILREKGILTEDDLVRIWEETRSLAHKGETVDIDPDVEAEKFKKERGDF